MSEIMWNVNKMTSNTAPSPMTVTSSSNLTGAYTAFDGTNTHFSIAKNNWVQLNYYEEMEVTNIRITANSSLDRNPTEFILYGTDELNTTPTVLFSVSGLVWLEGESTKTFSFENTKLYRSFRFTVVNSVASVPYITELEFGKVVYNRRAVLKNNISGNYYSLAEKTLIPLPDTSNKNMISFGIETGKEIKLDEDFDKIRYVQDTSETLGVGKVFKVSINSNNTKKITIDTKSE